MTDCERTISTVVCHLFFFSVNHFYKNIHSLITDCFYDFTTPKYFDQIKYDTHRNVISIANYLKFVLTLANKEVTHTSVFFVFTWFDSILVCCYFYRWSTTPKSIIQKCLICGGYKNNLKKDKIKEIKAYGWWRVDKTEVAEVFGLDFMNL